ncbi:succinyl-diaminopimelate desuccinylase [Alteribacillus persepolensis]|uniref:Probable succinyl-diaminopimelate desuccinylase n=1 Tax=Alteribacillus persepolensis TaxID=568899 RepID=A0A1G8AWG5_9BACI|nr:ArgE/DapE family deacylase [Alteribacillus persepolensis]SDH25126.1 succinyl-diaminopimelate desuccinylase [Alteribacillus persepolensis]
MDQEQAVSFLKDIIQIKSVNPPGNETAVAKKLKSLFDEYGIETELIEYDDNRANLIARVTGEQDGPVLGLTGHMDVVPIGENEWEHDPFGAEEENGKIYGRGACDMKSGLAACASAMVSLKEEGLPIKGTVTLFATVGEETGAVGARQLTEQGYADSLDALIIAEPTRNQVNIAHKGALWPQIITYGKTAHGSMPDKGINAVIHMNEIIHRIAGGDWEWQYEEDELLGGATYSIDVIKGGSNTNVVPDQCFTNIDMRTVPSQDHNQIIEQMQQVIEAAKEKYPDLKADIRILNDQSPVKTSNDDSFVKLVQDVVKVDGSAELGGITAYTDGSQFKHAQKEFPIVILGPGETSTAHQPDEYVEINKYLDSIHLYKEIAKKFLS